jgi:predicted small lipoprotein YifL
MRLLFVILFLGLSLNACGKKGGLVQPGPKGSYPKTYPSLPKSFEHIREVEDLELENAHTLQNN